MIINLARNLNLRCYLSDLSTLNTRVLTSWINLKSLWSRYLLTFRQSTVDVVCLCSVVCVASAEDILMTESDLNGRGTESCRGFLHVWQLIWDHSKAELSCGFQLKLLHITMWPGFPPSKEASGWQDFLMIQDSMSQCSSKQGGNVMPFTHPLWEVLCVTVSPSFTQIKGRGHRLIMGKSTKDSTAMLLKSAILIKGVGKTK